MLAPQAAAALVAASRLLDEEWYGEQVGRSFASRDEAAAHWVAHWAEHPDADTSPHPLFEPAWLYPGGRWRGRAPDPLSFHLSRGAAGKRSPHPCFDQTALGDLEEWLADHDPAELLRRPVPRAPVGEVVVEAPADDLGAAVAWLRHLARHAPDATVSIRPSGAAATRILRAVAADLPSARVGEDVAAPVRVSIPPGLRPPRWPWLADLVRALDRPGVDAATPLLVDEDFVVAGPVLAGHPVADAERLDGLPLPDLPDTVVARRGDTEDPPVLVTASRLVVDTVRSASAPDHLLRTVGFVAPGVPLTVREGRPALRWSIDIAAGAGPIGTRWGDYHFARSLAAALDRLGQWVSLDHPETRTRESRRLDDVVLVIRGLDRVTPPEHATSLLWVISHPDEVTAAEVAAYDAVFAAGLPWAAARSAEWGVPVEPLLQCTDTTRFRPGLAEGGSGVERLFVANARGELRASVAAALGTGTPLTVIGHGWEPWLPSDGVEVAATSVPNTELPHLYAAAGLVLNDHWADMRRDGFVSNRIFDVLATGARLLTDDVAGLHDVLGEEVRTWRDHAEFARLAAAPFDEHHPDTAARAALADRVVAEHSFDARAATLLDTALRLRTGQFETRKAPDSRG